MAPLAPFVPEAFALFLSGLPAGLPLLCVAQAPAEGWGWYNHALRRCINFWAVYAEIPPLSDELRPTSIEVHSAYCAMRCSGRTRSSRPKTRDVDVRHSVDMSKGAVVIVTDTRVDMLGRYPAGFDRATGSMGARLDHEGAREERHPSVDVSRNDGTGNTHAQVDRVRNPIIVRCIPGAKGKSRHRLVEGASLARNSRLHGNTPVRRDAIQTARGSL